jgi:hypothetical protein
MNNVERTKTHHLLSCLRVGIGVGQATEMLSTLTSSQRAQLDERVRALREHMEGSGSLSPNGLLDVVCLAFTLEESPGGQGKPRVTLGEQLFRPRNFGAEALLVRGIQRVLRRYATLPAADRDDLARYASSLEIDRRLMEKSSH